MRRKNNKGQAAVEFLTTYSWAILALIIALAALAYFDVFDGDRFTQEVCSSGSQLQCLESFVDSDGLFQLRIRNTYPVDVEVTQVNAVIDGVEYTLDIPGAGLLLASGVDTVVEGPILTGAILSEDSKVSIDFSLLFNRESSPNSYLLNGRTTTTVFEAGLFN